MQPLPWATQFHLERLTADVENAVAADSCTMPSRIAAAATAMTTAAMHAAMKLRMGTSKFHITRPSH